MARSRHLRDYRTHHSTSRGIEWECPPSAQAELDEASVGISKQGFVKLSLSGRGGAYPCRIVSAFRKLEQRSKPHVPRSKKTADSSTSGACFSLFSYTHPLARIRGRHRALKVTKVTRKRTFDEQIFMFHSLTNRPSPRA
jgi:hypothetical protein